MRLACRTNDKSASDAYAADTFHNRWRTKRRVGRIAFGAVLAGSAGACAGLGLQPTLRCGLAELGVEGGRVRSSGQASRPPPFLAQIGRKQRLKDEPACATPRTLEAGERRRCGRSRLESASRVSATPPALSGPSMRSMQRGSFRLRMVSELGGLHDRRSHRILSCSCCRSGSFRCHSEDARRAFDVRGPCRRVSGSCR